MKLNKKYYSIFILFFMFSCSFYSLNKSIPIHLENVVLQPTINETTEYKIGKEFESKFLKLLLEKNLLSITGYEKADCQLRFTIKKLNDTPYLLDDSKNVTSVKQWQIEIIVHMEWFDLVNQIELTNKNIVESVVYSLDSSSIINDKNQNNSGVEFATNREAAIEQCIINLSDRMINELTSTW